MARYRVFIRCDSLRVIEAGSQVRWGFFKNEYVSADDPDTAVQIAIRHVREQLREEPAVVEPDIDTLGLAIEAVDGGLPFWRGRRREGFIFFDADAEQAPGGKDGRADG